MSADWYLAGPCEGISLHRDGRTVTIKDTTGRELEYTQAFEDAERASAFVWKKRDQLYAKYDREAA
jgi:hypothetical protein